MVDECGVLLTVRMRLYRATETGAGLTGLCLVQAVRSYLHFSQLSAWLNKSAGAHPHQLLYRVKVSGPQVILAPRLNRLQPPPVQLWSGQFHSVSGHFQVRSG